MRVFVESGVVRVDVDDHHLQFTRISVQASNMTLLDSLLDLDRQRSLGTFPSISSVGMEQWLAFAFLAWSCPVAALGSLGAFPYTAQESIIVNRVRSLTNADHSSMRN